MCRLERIMLMNQIKLCFMFILSLSLYLAIETKSTVTLDKVFDLTTTSIQTEANLTSENDFDDTSFPFTPEPKLTFDEFFDYTTFPLLSFSPNGLHLLYQIRRPSWESRSYENSLWLYEIKTETKKLIAKDFSPYSTPQWSPSGNWIALGLKSNSAINITNDLHYHNQSLLEKPDLSEEHIYLYSIELNVFLPIRTEKIIPYALAWSHNDSSIYFAGNRLLPTKEEDDYYLEWRDVIQSRQRKKSSVSTIYCIDIALKNRTLSSEINIVKNLSFSISELVFVSSEEKIGLLFTSIDYNSEIYSLDLRNVSSLTRLTKNTITEKQLRLSTDRTNVLFTNGNSDGFIDGLYALNLTNGQIERFQENLMGPIIGYTPRSEGGVYILKHLQTEVDIYTQQSPTENMIWQPGWIGSYESIASSSNPNCSIAFVHSSSEWPMEVYCTGNINHLQSAKAITSENELFTKRNLPKTKVYNWKNKDDNQWIEGILHYPPEKFNFSNLPLLVLLHGGPHVASLNKLDANWHTWAPLAASEGWLVLEPNYRGSTGYGDAFSNQLRRKPLSLAGRDILSAVDSLIEDGIADPYRLAVGGYSFGGSLTNWLITQTKRFNAALSGAGTVEHASGWGITDAPEFYNYWFDGPPWERPHIYQNEAPIYQLDRVRTPTHIFTGTLDRRVPATQSYILERGLYSRGIPVKLLIFPNEGHSLNNDPWHGKIKVREELKWLQKYGEGKNYNA
jgi:dipeptidyl aminopeptidase/acylaminoacyl peptidase